MNFYSIKVKYKKNMNLYIGQFVNIFEDEEKYYFEIYEDGEYKIISSKISDEHENILEKYKYGIIRSINDDFIEVLVICSDGILNIFQIELTKEMEKGSAFIVRGNKLYDNNIVVGTISDKRYTNQDISFNSYNGKGLTVFIAAEKNKKISIFKKIFKK